MQEPTPQELRGHFVLDPTVHFLNHGSFGACPRVVLEEQRLLRERIEREPVRFYTRQLWPLLDEVRAALADFLSCDEGGLVFVPNATSGVNAVLSSIALERGDGILVTNHGYNACTNAARRAAERSGAEVQVAHLPYPLQDAEEIVAAIHAACTPRTKIALLDHITSPTGLILPLERLVDELQDKGIDVLVDGAHAPGQLPLDLGALNAAWYTGNCHKWLCTPKGSAFLHARADRREQTCPVITSHGYNTPRPHHTRLQDEFDWPGTIDPSAILTIKTAIEFLGSLFQDGWDGLRARTRSYALVARERLSQTLGTEPPAPAAMTQNLVSLFLPRKGQPQGAFETDPLHDALFEQFRVEIPVFPGPEPGQRLIRISSQIYNDEDDLQALEGALAALSTLV